MITNDFLLDTEEARKLYHDYAEPLPIIDFHSHLDPMAIAENRQYENIAQLWLEGDHYKWRAMRTHGIGEEFCSGKASDRDKFDRWAETVPALLRNPLYHWTHLELRRPFGIEGILLSPATADQIWNTTAAQLQSGNMGARDILHRMNVELVCTTDDPCDDLAAHQKQKASGDSLTMLPTFRPDKARHIQQLDSWNAWVNRLEQVVQQPCNNFKAFLCALAQRHQYFAEIGCKLSDHSIEFMSIDTLDEETAATIYRNARQGIAPSREQVMAFSNYMLDYFASLDAEKKWVRQLHIGALRNPNGDALNKLGADTGFDAIADFSFAEPLAAHLDRLAQINLLPRTIFYNLNPKDNEMLAVLCGSFQDGNIAGKMQWGAAWWFLDQMDGMKRQIEGLSQLGLLSHFVGMLTDSRSFLSYTRHEYFRRILCRILGRDMADGLIPHDYTMVGNMVANISYHNAKQYFSF